MFNLSTTSLSASQIANAYTTIVHAGTSTALSSDQVTALTTEINTDPSGLGYKTSGVLNSSEVVCQLLNVGGYVPNPNPQGTITVTSMPKQQFLGIATEFLAAVEALPDSNAYKATILATFQSEETLLAAVDPVDLTNPAVTGMFTLLVESTAVTQDQINAIVSPPDPSWPAQVYVSDGVSRVAPGFFITPDDITAAGL